MWGKCEAEEAGNGRAAVGLNFVSRLIPRSQGWVYQTALFVSRLAAAISLS
jgi:hypothetical protein